jgi:hypothetical protein
MFSPPHNTAMTEMTYYEQLHMNVEESNQNPHSGILTAFAKQDR